MRTIANPKTRISLEMLDPKPMSILDIRDIYAPLNSPSLTGTPTTVTPTSNSTATMIANKKYVDDSISALINGAPSSLDTLKELADVLSNNQSAVSQINSTLSNKLDANSADYIKSLSISGKTITYKKGNNSTGTLTTQDTTYSAGTNITISGTTINAKDQLPARTGNSGKFLTNNGSTMNWSSIPTASLVLGNSTAITNATTATSNPYLNIVENSTNTGSIRIKGANATSVSAINGEITISSTNTVYTHPTPGSKSGGPDSNKTPSFGGTFVVPQISSNSEGHVTSITNREITIPATTVSSTTAGIAPKGSTNTSLFLRADGTWVAPPNTTYNVFVKSGSSAAAGLVPAPSTTAGTTKYLREDGQWKVPPGTTTDTNDKVAQKVSTSNKSYPMLFVGTANAASDISANYTYFGSGINANPYTSTITATTFKGNLTGNVTGNCSGSSGSCTGNAATATKMKVNKNITVKLKVGDTEFSKTVKFNDSDDLVIDLGTIIQHNPDDVDPGGAGPDD